MRRAAAVLVALGLLAPRPAGAFGPGEQLVLEVRYGKVLAGRASVTLGAPVEQAGRPLWPVVVLANTEALFSLYPLHDKFVSWWDPDRGRSVGWDLVANEMGRLRRERCKLNSPSERQATLQSARAGEASRSEVLDIDPASQDLAGAYYALRGLDLRPGAHFRLPVLTERRGWVLELTVGQPEAVEVPAGRYAGALPVEAVVQFEGKLAAQRAVRLWVSGDPGHVLLRADAELAVGAVHAELLEYRPGNTPGGGAPAAQERAAGPEAPARQSPAR